MSDFITGGVWNVAPIDVEPEIQLYDWQVYEVDGLRQNVGARSSSGRVSSAIVTFDKETMRGVTKSGRVYELVGLPGMNMDAEYVWSTWKVINKVTSEQNVTRELITK